MRPLISKLNITCPDIDNNMQMLIDMSIQGINERYAVIDEAVVPQDVLEKRAAYELDIILSMGFANYFLIVGDYLQFGTMLGHVPDDRLKFLRANMAEMSTTQMKEYAQEDQSAPGMTIGLGRGSAAGSVIAFALKITNLEPITHGLLFERFLNPERVSMPDIDSDLSNAKKLYGIRDIVIEYVSKKYGKDAICSIVTKGTLKAKASIDRVIQVMISKQAQIQNISADNKELKDQFYDLGRELKSFIPEDDPNACFDTEISEGVTVKDAIRSHFADNKKALEILDFAIQLEGVNINYGKHAAGVVIADNGDVGAYGALMWQDDDEYKGWKFQMDGPDVEGVAGLLKMDFLGLTTLNIITAAARYIQQNTGTYIDLDNLPDEPEIYQEIFSKGNTFGVFQFESAVAKKILKNFKPTCFEDIIIINAINRPGPAQYIDPITAKKHGQHVDETVFDKVPCIQDILNPTYGYPVYQEQVMQIFQKMGQYSLGGADEIRRAMSKKKKAVIEENREIFVHGGELVNHDTHKSTHVDGAVSVGIPEQFAYEVYDSIQDFAKYGFNKSHAAVYAKTAYITAWLKYHYPVEFFTAYLNIKNDDKDDLKDALIDAKKNKVKILPPDINDSQNYFTCDSEHIRYGFYKIGLEAKMQSEPHDYVSMADFILRTTLTKTAIEKLINAGALDRFSTSRAALHKVLPIYMDYKEDYKKAAEKYDNYTRLLRDMDAGIKINKDDYGMKNRKTIPSRNQIVTTIDSSKKEMDNAEMLIKSQIIPSEQFPDNLIARLQKEKEVLKTYISGHPLDVYGNPEKYGCQPLGNPVQGNCNIMGMITGLRRCFAKKTPDKQMAFFTLEDATGSIPVCAFTDAYEHCGNMLEDDKVVLLKGYIKPDTRSNDGTLQFVIDKNDYDAVSDLKVAPCDVQVKISGVEEYMTTRDALSVYADQTGHTVYVMDMTTGQLSKMDFKISDAALDKKLVTKL